MIYDECLPVPTKLGTPIGLLGFHRISNVIKKESEFQDHARASWFGDLQFYKRTQLILINFFPLPNIINPPENGEIVVVEAN